MAISLVNSVGVTAGGASTTIASTALSMSTGNFVYVMVTLLTGTVSSVTDTAGNTYVNVPGATVTLGIARTEVWYAKNITGNASNVVTANLSGSFGGRRIHVLQYSGVDLTSPLGDDNTATVNPGTSISASVTTTTANELIIASAAGDTDFTATAPLTARVNTNTSKESTGDQIEAAAGTYTPTFTMSSSDSRLSVTTWKAVAGGAATWPGYQSPFGWR